MKLYKLTYLFVLLLSLTGCEHLMLEQKVHKENNNLDIVKITFDSIHKNFQAEVLFSPSLSAALLQKDSTLRFKVTELVEDDKINLETQPQLLDIKNVRQQEIQQLDIDVVTLVDLTLDEATIEQQKKVVMDLKNILTERNLQVAFLKNKSVTKAMSTSDYVMDNYFKPSKGEKLFYRHLLSTYQDLLDKEVPRLNEQYAKQDSISQQIKPLLPKQKLLIVLSDGKVYDEKNQPIDNNHFTLQRSLTQVIDSSSNIPVLFINLKESQDEALDARDSDNLLKLLCQNSKGKFFDTYVGDLFIYNLLSLFEEQFSSYTFFFQNPDHKVYRGYKSILEISCFRKDSLVASDNIDYYLGSVYNPMIVNGTPTLQIIIIGIILGSLSIALIYLILQFVVPFVSYLLFKKKYVTCYTGDNMSFNNKLVGKECYFCKAPFEKGDEIVAKCHHVVHKSCWDENEYKCPEYGKNCKHGSHYYNQEKLYDVRNAPFFLTWVLAGAISALISWVVFILMAYQSEGTFLEMIIPVIFGVEPHTEESLNLIEEYGSHLLYLPFYGLNIGFFLTFALSLLTGHGRWWWKRITLVFAKAILGGLLGYVSFVLGSMISIALNFTDNSLLIDWIPWLLSGFGITAVVAYGTEIKLKRALIGAAVSVVLGLGSTYWWSSSFVAQYDTRAFLLLGYMIYSVGFALSIAVTFPKSERYFLRVEGPIKEMDIALYKWMNAQLLNKHIYIGKSVGCELQMTWDITSNIAPKQAEVLMERGFIYLMALEEGVFIDQKPLRANQKVRLYHGTKFMIGKTLFTYVEKDI